MLGAQIGDELVEIFPVLPREDHESAGEAVAAAILRDGGFAFRGFGTTG